MEALIILLAELVVPVIIAFAVLMAETAILIANILVSLAFSRTRGSQRPAPPTRKADAAPPTTTARRQGGRRWSGATRMIGKVTAAALAVTLGGLLLIEFVLLEPAARLMVAMIGARTGTELDFKSASGSLFTGTITFEDFLARRQSEIKSSFDLKAGILRADLDLMTLVRPQLAFESIAVSSVSGTMRRPERRRTDTDDNDDTIRAKRIFHVRELTLTDVGVALSKGDAAPVAVSLTSVDSREFRSNYALFDLLFRSEVKGQLDGHDFTISTLKAETHRESKWRAPDLPAVTVARLVSRPPIGWLSEGTVAVDLDARINEGAPTFAKTDMQLDWTLRMQSVRAEARDGAGLRERALMLPVIGFIKAKSGNFDLRFGLAMNQTAFENRGSIDVRALWSGVLRSMGTAIARRTGLTAGDAAD
jgi:hypothetical protein